jgi:hypothetical protein
MFRKEVKMLKRSMIALAVVALLATGVQAGELKVHNWPCVFQALEITTIPVVVDIGYYVVIPDQGKLKIKLAQDTSTFSNFKGCLGAGGVSKMVVKTNFELSLSASVSSSIPGTWSVHLDKTANNYDGPSSVTIASPGSDVYVCVKLAGKAGNGETLAAIAALGNPGTTQQVATVKISVKPTGTPGCGSGSANNGW